MVTIITHPSTAVKTTSSTVSCIPTLSLVSLRRFTFPPWLQCCGPRTRGSPNLLAVRPCSLWAGRSPHLEFVPCSLQILPPQTEVQKPNLKASSFKPFDYSESQWLAFQQLHTHKREFMKRSKKIIAESPLFLNCSNPFLSYGHHN